MLFYILTLLVTFKGFVAHYILMILKYHIFIGNFIEVSDLVTLKMLQKYDIEISSQPPTGQRPRADGSRNCS